MSSVQKTDISVAPFEGDPNSWDEFVRSQQGWTHFHLYGWKSVFERVFQHETIYLAAYNIYSELIGVLPLVRVKSIIFGHYLVSIPFFNYGGPLGSKFAIKSLANFAESMAKDQSVSLLELRSRTCLDDVSLAPSHRKITVLLDLEPYDADAVWNKLKTKVRTKVRRPRKEGVIVRFGTEQLDNFFALYSRRMRDLGTPTQSRLSFEVMLEVFPDDMLFGCAYLNNEPVAAGCGFVWDDEFEMTWSAGAPEYNRLGPTKLLYWEFMKLCAELGLSCFNFGRATPGSPTHKFKREWGGRDEQLWWYQYSAKGVISTPSPDSAGFSWGPKIWKHLPIGIANTLGPIIVRNIP